jgi:flagella basal body P-ring formation protein FlgA
MIVIAAIPMIFLAASPGSCLSVSGNQVMARDLAAANPLFASLDPDLPFGFAPLPGARRVLLGQELAGFAKRNGLKIDNQAVGDICIERAAAPLRPDEITSALQTAIGIAGSKIELIDYSKQPLPPGRLEFKWNSVGAPAAHSLEGSVIWRGRLIYDPQHSLMVWAKVRISLEHPVVVAAEDLVPGRPVEARQIKVVRLEQPLPGRTLLETPESVVGNVVSRRVPAGQPLESSLVRKPEDISRGESVQMRVVNGAAYVSFEGIAVSGGRTGDTILVRNPASKRIVRGVVEAKGKVVLQAGGAA